MLFCIALERTPAPGGRMSTPHQKAVTEDQMEGLMHLLLSQPLGPRIVLSTGILYLGKEKSYIAYPAKEIMDPVISEFASGRFNYPLTTFLCSG